MSSLKNFTKTDAIALIMHLHEYSIRCISELYIIYICICTLCLFGVYSICHESRGRVDKWDTAQIDMIQMACIPFLIGLPICICILDTTNSTKLSFLYTVNEPEDNIIIVGLLRKVRTLKYSRY